MVEDKLKSLKATGAERVVSADCGCLMNILGHAAWKDQQEGRKTPSLPGEHIASFLLRRTAK
jgi:L-lactate dehydrogenase complex protein LldE